MPTQQALYADLAERSFDPELSWAEHELPERVRTKHVHRLHPYLGKFVPQLVETFLRRHFRPGQRILDPFAGSGTTLVECTTYGAHSVGVDVSAFNVLLSGVKTARYDAGRGRARPGRRAAAAEDWRRRARGRPAGRLPAGLVPPRRARPAAALPRLRSCRHPSARTSAVWCSAARRARPA